MKRRLALAATLALTLATSAAGGDLDTVRERLVRLYGGRAGEKAGKLHAAALADLEARVSAMMKRTPVTAEPDTAKTDALPYDVANIFQAVLPMAQAYAAPESSLKDSPQLKAVIERELRRGLKWFRPGTARPGNWYPWLISAPQSLGPTLVLLRDKIDRALFAECLKALQAQLGEPMLNGANAVWEARNHLYLAMLLPPAEGRRRMATAMRFLLPELTVHEESGILEDYSFQFHGRLLHTSGYGSGFAQSAAEMIYLTDGTEWSVAKENRAIFEKHLTEHAQWVVAGAAYDLSVKGRGVLSGGPATGHLEAMLLVGCLDSPREYELSEAALGLLNRSVAKPPFKVARLADAIAREIGPLMGFRHFYVSDFAVCRGKDFYTSVRMYSNRLIDYEGNWGMNLRGWFLCYGMTYIARSGNEYWADRATLREHFDWDRLPGTTTRPGVRPPKAYNTGTSRFAGGTSLDDTTSGVCGFVLKPAAGDFIARKSYHFFDRGFVALGSGITSTAEHAEPVVTTVTQWAAPKERMPLILSTERAIVAVKGTTSWPNISWAWYDGVGYFFPKPVTLHGHRRGTLTTLWLDHGNAPTDARYAYVVLPKITVQELKDFAAKPTIEVLRHDTKAHACRHIESQRAGIVFWHPGAVGRVTVDRPAIVNLSASDGSLRLAVQNPLHTAARVNVTIDYPVAKKTFGLPPETSAGPRGEGVRFSIDTAAGRIYRMTAAARKPTQQPREDNLAFTRFAAKVHSKGKVTWLDATIPEEARKAEGGYRLLVRGSQGHLRRELTRADIVDVPEAERQADVVRYKWIREGDNVQRGSFRLVLITRLHHAIEHFTVPEAEGK